MKKVFNKALKTRVINQDDLRDLIDFVNQPENKDDYYISSESKKDRIGNYREFFVNPKDIKNQTKYKIYEIKDEKDLTSFRLQYYDILRDESISFLKKSMLLYTLQKRIEYTFKDILRNPDNSIAFKDVNNLLEKVKKARSYYAFKVFLDDNSSNKKIKNSKDSVTKVVSKSK